MASRTSSRTVTFKRPFALSGIERLPAGTYAVETEEEALDVSFPAFRRTATFIFLPCSSHAATPAQMVTIDPLELEAALARDVIEVAVGTE
jgi:hypothetical protein